MIVKNLGIVAYQDTLAQMSQFTGKRNEDTPDELWFLQHHPVFTQGQAGKKEHILSPGDIPIVQSDRGGQVTYHGPGQLVCYLLMDLRRKHFGVRDLVDGIENSIIQLLDHYGIESSAKREAPGVYVQDSKIAQLGLRVKKGCSYHGLSLNIAMDLEPFERINPCGFEGLKVTDLRNLGVRDEFSSVATRLLKQLERNFGYDPSPHNL
jgi:lipoyl(octanoyl) transferase